MNKKERDSSRKKHILSLYSNKRKPSPLLVEKEKSNKIIIKALGQDLKRGILVSLFLTFLIITLQLTLYWLVK